MKINYLKSHLITVLFLGLMSCNSQSKNEENGSKKEKMVDWNTLSKSSYSIQYPKDWTLDESGQMGTSFILFSPLESSNDQFKENINLLIQDVSQYNMDLDKYTKVSEDQIKSVITNAKSIESKRVKNKDNEYHKLIYTGEQGVFKLKFEQYYWVLDNTAYVLTLTGEQDKFDQIKGLGESILNSFELKK